MLAGGFTKREGAESYESTILPVYHSHHKYNIPVSQMIVHQLIHTGEKIIATVYSI